MIRFRTSLVRNPSISSLPLTVLDALLHFFGLKTSLQGNPPRIGKPLTPRRTGKRAHTVALSPPPIKRLRRLATPPPHKTPRGTETPALPHADPPIIPVAHSGPPLGVEAADPQIDCQVVGGRLQKFWKRWAFSSWSQAIVRHGLGWS